MGYFSVDWEDFSLRLRVEAAPNVPRAKRLIIEVGSGVPLISFVILAVTVSENSLKLFAGIVKEPALHNRDMNGGNQNAMP